ncbi:SusD/RagB family nutrient-binding outer membrane lipoprotein [Ekhidna sp.]|uniref:SusD/RagB family nutrient-binding outer membrane lipoprotein n=1 Tax=Ekhidna sp. TaxID=2608089 RepID=UPI003514538A
MKIINRISIVLLLGGIFACESFTEDLRIDPNRPLDADATNMIQGPMVANQLFHAGEVARLVGLWTNHFTGQDRQYVGLNDWNTTASTDFDSPWGTAYYGIITQSRIAADKAIAEGNPALAGIAQVLEAHAMGTVTSLWGDVPFTEAADDTNPNPAYDSQSDVYTGLQNLLDDAITNLAAGGPGISSAKDIFYGGNLASWTELAYTLKARYYLHTGDYADAATNAALGISSAANDMIADFGAGYGTSFNPYYSFLVYDRSGYMGAMDAYAPTIMDPDGNFANTYGGANRNHAKHDEGARFYYYYEPFEYYTAGYEPNFLNGFDWGCQDCGRFGEDFPLVTYGETLLIIAEAEARLNGLSAGVTAYNTYRALINGGYGFTTNLGVTTWDFQAYVDADFNPGGLEDPGSTASSPVNALLREIYEERYISLAGTVEPFTDLRRTNNIAEIQLKNFSGVPQRLIYPQSEINTNTSTPSPLPDVLTATEVHGGS